MRAFSRLRPLGVIAIMAFPLAACSADGFKDMVGLSKSSPDETQVATSRPLALPPDYALKPPTEPVAAPEAAPAPDPAPTQTASLQTAAPSPVPSATPAPSPTPDGTAAPAPAATAAADPNVISKTNPDGTPKTAKQIREEARQIKIAREKAKNPNYGTWKNLLGVIWD